MQLLSKTTNSSASACAERLLDALPPIMRVVRRHMRSHRDKGLSLPQFRALVLLRSAPEANLSAVADFLGASLPTASRIVTGLVAKGYVFRRECPGDRRQVKLALTPRGAAALKSAHDAARTQLARTMESLSQSDRRTVLRATELLYLLFSPGLRENCSSGGGSTDEER
jgi:DNA-binding MarR family transcriptional regulator